MNRTMQWMKKVHRKQKIAGIETGRWTGDKGLWGMINGWTRYLEKPIGRLAGSVEKKEPMPD